MNDEQLVTELLAALQSIEQVAVRQDSERTARIAWADSNTAILNIVRNAIAKSQVTA